MRPFFNLLLFVPGSLMNLDARGLQRLAFEFWRDTDVFFQRIKKALGLSIFQAMVICKSMRELTGMDTAADEVV